MPTLVADAYEEPRVIADALVSAGGYTWQNPGSGEISIFNGQGDRLVVASVEAALEEFESGALLQLWLSESDDLAIGHAENRVRLYFDGLKACQVARCLEALRSQGVGYRVDTE